MPRKVKKSKTVEEESEKEEEPSEDFEDIDAEGDGNDISEEEEQGNEEETEPIEPLKAKSGTKLKSKTQKQPKGSAIKTKKKLKSTTETKPKGTPIKTKKKVEIKENNKAIPKGIYPFDKGFLKSYRVLLEMLKDRGYNFDMPGIGMVPGVETKENGNGVKVNVTDVTGLALEKQLGGLENFKLALTHEEDEQLNILIYYLPPEVEAKSASAPRKQIAAEQIRKALEIFETYNDYPRLILLARTKLAIQAADLIRNANNQILDDKPQRLIQFFNMDIDLSFNYMKSRYQSKVLKILRTEEEQNEYLSQLTIDEQQTDKRRALPIIQTPDAVSEWYGLKVNDLMLFKRINAPSITFALRVVRPPEELN